MATDVILPDYAGGGLVNLMATIRRALGGTAEAPVLDALPPDALDPDKHLVLLVIDGLGHAALQRLGGGMAQHLRARLTSVFPSTTASAIPTFMTGQAPAQHGLIGWNMQFRELGAQVSVLPFVTRLGRQPLAAAGIHPAGLLGLRPIFERLPVPCHVLAPRAIVDSAFSAHASGRARRHGYDDLDGMFATLAELLRQAPVRSYVFAYYPELDALAHRHGIASPEVAACHAALDAALGGFREAVRGVGVQVLVTADHGFIDTGPEDVLDLAAHPRLRALLASPLSGEGRVAYAHVRCGCGERFEDYLARHLADRVELWRSEEAIRVGWFGPGLPHPELAARAGDYVLLARGHTVIRDWLPGEEPYRHVGVHGGLSAAEMYVPLLLM